MTAHYSNPAEDIVEQDVDLDALAHVVTDAQVRAMSAAAYTMARSELYTQNGFEATGHASKELDDTALAIAQSQCVALAQIVYFTTRRALYERKYPERFKQPITLAVLTIEETDNDPA